MSDRILRGKDLAQRDGAKTQRAWIEKLSRKMMRQLETPFSGVMRADAPVKAEIDWGRWIARCECGGAEYVDPDEQIFYCFSCGNHAVRGDGRPVVFPTPEERELIEAAVMEREIDPVQRGSNVLARAVLARPTAVGLARCWKPGQTADDLKQELKQAKESAKEETDGL